MGTYVYFLLGDSDGIRARFLEDFGSFFDWFQASVKEFSNDFPVEVQQKMHDVCQRGSLALKAETDEEARLIDRLVHEYWNFCDITGLHYDKDVTPSALKLYRYARDLSEVIPTASEVARCHYRRLFRGCSIAEFPGHTYQSEDGIFSLSWLLLAEAEEFLAELESFEGQLKKENATDAEAGVQSVLQSLRIVVQKRLSLVVVIA